MALSSPDKHPPASRVRRIGRRLLQVGAILVLVIVAPGASLISAAPASAAAAPEPIASSDALQLGGLLGGDPMLPGGITVRAARSPYPINGTTPDVRFAARPSWKPINDFWLRVVRGLFWIVLALLAIYTARHWLFTINRLYSRSRAPYVDIDSGAWPLVTVFIAAHNEEAVIAHCIEALLDVSYPAERVRIVPVNDRSQDRTAEIIEDFKLRYPERIFPFHRSSGKPGKAAALKDAMDYAEGEIILIFDADYIPGRGLLKQLVAPFFDPEVGAVMGRVIPLNADTNLLTRLLELERAGGYQVDQQARMNMSLVPQYGGTVGGIRRSAMDAAGGWHDDILAEDTDITYRLLVRGWKTVYQNRSECYEEVPEGWRTRIRQIRRWSKGHNQTLARRVLGLLRAPLVPIGTKIDGLLLLGVFVMPSALVFGSGLALILYFTNSTLVTNSALALFAAASCGTVGNLAAFFEIAAADKLDGNNRRVRLIPFNLVGFLVSCVSIANATWELVVHDWLLEQELSWDKTARYRRPGDGGGQAAASSSSAQAASVMARK